MIPACRQRTTRSLDVADERALEVACGGATMLFGIGPPWPTGDPARRAAAVLRALEPSVRQISWCEQVHSPRVVAAPEAGDGTAASIGRGDGLISDRRGAGLMVWTADCVPVLLAGGGVVAAVHAGWRGAAAGIIPAAIEHCRELYGVAPPQLEAVLGPAISGQRYQVGPEVVAALDAQGVDRKLWLEDDRVELRGFVAAQLGALGVEGVSLVGGCTAATSRMASFRRDGAAAGRQWSLVFREP